MNNGKTLCNWQIPLWTKHLTVATCMLSIRSSYVHCSMSLRICDIINCKVQFLVYLQRVSMHRAGDTLTCSRMTNAALRISRGRSPSTSTPSPFTTTACLFWLRPALGKRWVFADCRCPTILVERIATHYFCSFKVKTDNSNVCEQHCCKK